MHPLLTTIQNGKTATFRMLLKALGDHFDLLHDLGRTPQDPEWHAEGDVATHTTLVLEACFDLLAGSAAHLTAERRLALVLGALLHDIGKPLTTRVEVIHERERIISPHHTERGASYAAYRLLELGLPYHVTQEVLALIRHHHDPKRLVRRASPTRSYRRLARLADLELLYFLELADIRGRHSADLDAQLEAIEFFRLVAEEDGLWQNPDPYQEWRETIDTELAAWDPATRALVLAQGIRDAEEGLISTPYEAIARGYTYQGGFPRFVLLCGPSGAGKSSWAAERVPGYHLVSLDELREQIAGKRADQSVNGRVRQAAREQLKHHLRRGGDVVWDATSLRKDFRRPLLQLGFDYGAHVTLVVFHLSEEEFFARNEARAEPVPRSVLRRQIDTIEWPSASEAHRLLFVNGVGEVIAQVE
jgi:putative nucleotidyltransferase with HDIG domain